MRKPPRATLLLRRALTLPTAGIAKQIAGMQSIVGDTTKIREQLAGILPATELIQSNLGRIELPPPLAPTEIARIDDDIFRRQYER